MTELPSPGPANGAYALGKAMNTVLMQVRVHQSISPQAPMGYSELITFLRACTKELEGYFPGQGPDEAVEAVSIPAEDLTPPFLKEAASGRKKAAK